MIINNTINRAAQTTRPAQNTNRYTRKPVIRQTLPASNLTYIENGNIHDSTMQFTLIGCNTQGIMEFGLAGQFAKRYPEILRPYQEAIQNDRFTTGSAMRARTSKGRELILLGIWKLQQFGNKIEWIEQSLCHIYDALHSGKLQMDSLATVPLGCGGTSSQEWDVVGPRLALWLSSLGIPVEIYVGRDYTRYFVTTNEDGQAVTSGLSSADLTRLSLESDIL